MSLSFHTLELSHFEARIASSHFDFTLCTHFDRVESTSLLILQLRFLFTQTGSVQMGLGGGRGSLRLAALWRAGKNVCLYQALLLDLSLMMLILCGRGYL